MFSPRRAFELYSVDDLLQSYRASHSRGDKPFSALARLFLSNWVSSALVGLEDRAADMLDFALDFSERSMKVVRGRDRGLEGARWAASRTGALAAWASGNDGEQRRWLETAKLHAAEYRDLEPRLGPNDQSEAQIDHLLLRACARQPAEAMAYYEDRFGPLDVRLKASSSVKRIVLEYARASQDASLRTELLHRAGRRILASRLESLFGHTGQVEKGGLWLKLVYAGPDSPLTPPQVIRKAYENMPNTPWPDFLAPD